MFAVDFCVFCVILNTSTTVNKDFAHIMSTTLTNQVTMAAEIQSYIATIASTDYTTVDEYNYQEDASFDVSEEEYYQQDTRDVHSFADTYVITAIEMLKLCGQFTDIKNLDCQQRIADIAFNLYLSAIGMGNDTLHESVRIPTEMDFAALGFAD